MEKVYVVLDNFYKNILLNVDKEKPKLFKRTLTRKYT